MKTFQDRVKEGKETSAFYAHRKDPIVKSIKRHGLKEIDKKWAGRKVPAPEHALNKLRK